jgi:hypothetical protein
MQISTTVKTAQALDLVGIQFAVKQTREPVIFEGPLLGYLCLYTVIFAVSGPG